MSASSLPTSDHSTLASGRASSHQLRLTAVPHKASSQSRFERCARTVDILKWHVLLTSPLQLNSSTIQRKNRPPHAATKLKKIIEKLKEKKTLRISAAPRDGEFYFFLFSTENATAAGPKCSQGSMSKLNLSQRAGFSTQFEMARLPSSSPSIQAYAMKKSKSHA